MTKQYACGAVRYSVDSFQRGLTWRIVFCGSDGEQSGSWFRRQSDLQLGRHDTLSWNNCMIREIHKTLIVAVWRWRYEGEVSISKTVGVARMSQIHLPKVDQCMHVARVELAQFICCWQGCLLQTDSEKKVFLPVVRYGPLLHRQFTHISRFVSLPGRIASKYYLVGEWWWSLLARVWRADCSPPRVASLFEWLFQLRMLRQSFNCHISTRSILNPFTTFEDVTFFCRNQPDPAFITESRRRKML